jgi:hypothetical protein
MPERGHGSFASSGKLRVRTLIQNASDFCVNVHNAALPNGAIRGQLSD